MKAPTLYTTVRFSDAERLLVAGVPLEMRLEDYPDGKRVTVTLAVPPGTGPTMQATLCAQAHDAPPVTLDLRWRVPVPGQYRYACQVEACTETADRLTIVARLLARLA